MRAPIDAGAQNGACADSSAAPCCAGAAAGASTPAGSISSVVLASCCPCCGAAGWRGKCGAPVEAAAFSARTIRRGCSGAPGASELLGCYAALCGKRLGVAAAVSRSTSAVLAPVNKRSPSAHAAGVARNAHWSRSGFCGNVWPQSALGLSRQAS